jgi:hypothetical protein
MIEHSQADTHYAQQAHPNPKVPFGKFDSKPTSLIINNISKRKN